MRKLLGRLLILLLVFLGSVTVTAFLLNSETTDDRSDMNAPSFPEVMVDFGGRLANRMCGYAQPMQADFMRDSVTPLDTTKSLKFMINPYDTEVSSLSYEIRTSDGSKVMENRKVKNLGTEDSYLSADIAISSDLRLNQEYSMQIMLETSAGNVYYYTRVVSRSGLNTENYISFVQSFYENCMDKNMADNLASYLEPQSSGTATNFANIDIHSTLAEVSWGSLSPQIYKRGIPVIKDINETTASITMDYQMSAKNSDGQTEIYDVSEFYRMRYTQTRIRLLDFYRSTRQVFDPELSVITDAGLLLGIRDRNVTYLTSEDNSIIAFAQEGDLWTYTPESGKMVEVFSFRRNEKGDYRDSRTDHAYKIIRVESGGDMDFVLYGYMNRGIHEGYTGVCVYHYNSDQNLVEEKLFIPSTESHTFLDSDMGTLSYVSEDNCLYLLLAGKLYRVDIDAGTYETMEEGIRSENFAVSDTNAHASWLVTEGADEGKIKEIDFETRAVHLLQPAKGQQLRVCGYMNEDLVYGILLDGDTLEDASGRPAEGLHTLRIEDFEGNLKKEYHQEGLYITDITVGTTLMEFELSAKGSTGYVVRRKDNIVNNIKAVTNRIAIELTNLSRTGTMVRLSFGASPDTKTPLVITAKMRSIGEQTVLLDTQIPEDNIYYVYAYGSLDSMFTDPALAVQRADAQLGVVLNRAQQYVWERGNKRTKQMLNVEDIPTVMRDGSWNADALQEELGESGTVIDLSGCTLDSVLYEVSAQRPVLARTGKNTTALIVGYDEYNTYLYDKNTGETYPYGMGDSTELFEKAGNLFLTYIERVEY